MACPDRGMAVVGAACAALLCYIAVAFFAVAKPALSTARLASSEDVACLVAGRLVDRSVVFLTAGFPAYDFKLLVRYDKVARHGARAVRLTNRRILESSSLRCVGELCTDTAVLLARADGAHATTLRRAAVAFELVDPSAVPMSSSLGYDGEISLSVNDTALLSSSMYCFVAAAAATQAAQASTAVRVVQAVGTEQPQFASLVSTLDALCPASAFCTESLQGCDLDEHVDLFPQDSLHEQLWLGTERTSSLYDRNEKMLELLRRRAERSGACTAKLHSGAADSAALLAHASTNRSMSSVPFRRLAAYELRADVGDEAASLVARQTAALSLLAGLRSSREAVDSALHRAIIVILVTCTIYLHGDNAASTGDQLYSLCLQAAQARAAAESSASSGRPPSRAQLLPAAASIACGYASLTLLAAEAALPAVAAVAGCSVLFAFLALYCCPSVVRHYFLGFPAAKWHDAIFGLACVTARILVNNSRFGPLTADGFGRCVAADAVAGWLSLNHWFVRHLIILCRCAGRLDKQALADPSTLGGTNAVTDGIAAMVLSFSPPPVLSGAESFDSVARLMIVGLGIVVLLPRTLWASACTGTHAIDTTKSKTARLLSALAVAHLLLQLSAVVLLATDLFVSPSAVSWMRAVAGDPRLLSAVLLFGMSTLGSSRALRQAKCVLQRRLKPKQ